ncbi:MAG: xanthine dehydrogenase family protein subunit M [Caldisericota bacterium]|nr:xanthine dehydrogenase family protein subunit M [Caldisericota bacterium]
MLHQFSYIAPRSREDLLELLTTEHPHAKILAGGTDLLVNIRSGTATPSMVIDIKRIAEYSGITWSDAEGLVLRPAVTINDVLRDPAVRDHFPLLQECGHDLASYQIRNRATVIGNVVNASPCSDMAPGLLCLGAQVVIGSSRGTRTVPLEKFFKGVKETALAVDELVERIIVPAQSKGSVGRYRKLKRVNGHDLAVVGVAVAVVDGRVRIAVSSAAPTPVVTKELARDISVDEAVETTMNMIHPISDIRCTKEYREFMASTFVRRLLAEVRG